MVGSDELGTLVRLMDEGGAAYVGTRDAALRPAIATAAALALADEPGTLVAYLPLPLAGPATANLRDNGQAAIVVCRIADFRTYQVKGTLVRLREAREDERALVERQHDAFAREADEDLTGNIVRAWPPWPCVVAEIAAREIYLQTPVPGTGRRLA